MGIGIIDGLAGGLYLSTFVKGSRHEVYPIDALSIVMPMLSTARVDGDAP
jgi:hypothetical protein